MPPAYALELLTIFAWEKGCGKDAFSLAQGLRTVLGLIQQYQHLCVSWTTNYSLKDPAIKNFLLRQLERPRDLLASHHLLSHAWVMGRQLTMMKQVVSAEGQSQMPRAHFLIQWIRPRCQSESLGGVLRDTLHVLYMSVVVM